MSDNVDPTKVTKAKWAAAHKLLGSRGLRVIETYDLVVTNGHFAIKVTKDELRACESRAGFDFETLESDYRDLLPNRLRSAECYLRTGVQVEDRRVSRLYQGPQDIAAFDTLYLDMLGQPEAIYAESALSLGMQCEQDPQWWIYPRRVDLQQLKAMAPKVATASKASLESAINEQ